MRNASTVATAVAPVEVAKMTSVRWKIFLLMLFLISINYIDRASLSVAMPLIAKEFDIGPGRPGPAAELLLLDLRLHADSGRHAGRPVQARASSSPAPPLGWGFFQADRRRRTGWVLLLLTRLGLGAAEAPIYPAGGKLNAIWMTQNERGRGATLLDGGAPLGAALGSIVIAGLIAGLGLLAAVLRRRRRRHHPRGLLVPGSYIRNHPREHPGVNDAEARYIEEAHAAEDAAVAGDGRRRPRATSSATGRCGRCASAGCSSTRVFYGLLTWMPNYLFKVHGFDIKQLGGASFVIFFAGFVGELVGGWLADHWKARGGSPEHGASHAVRRRRGRRHGLDLLGRPGHGPARRRRRCCQSRCSSCAGAACTGSSRRSSRRASGPASWAA